MENIFMLSMLCRRQLTMWKMIAFLFVALAASTLANAQSISTVAGASPLFDTPSAIAVDSGGNIYVADTFNHRVRRVTPAGVVSLVTGTGVAGSTGDGGSASGAQVSVPAGIALDLTGNIYIAEYLGHRIRKISSTGVISTVAGNGIAGFGGDGGPATGARLNGPWGLALDAAGNLFIADADNHRIRRVGTDGVITTVAGTGIEGYSGDDIAATSANLARPLGVAIDAANNIWIADTRNHRVRRISNAGIISTGAGLGLRFYGGDGGPATNAYIALPTSVKLDAGGSVYVSDSGNNRIRKFTPGGNIKTIAGNGAYGFSGDGGAAVDATLAQPYDVAADANGNVYIADTDNNRIRKISPPTPVATVRDFNGDNKSDIVYRDAAGNSGVLLMNGTTTLSATAILTAGSGWAVTHAADFDGDGKADLLIKNTDGQIAILLMNGGSLRMAGLLVGAGSPYTPVATGDFDGDGKADIVLENTDGSTVILLMNGLTVTVASYLVTPGSPWKVTHIGDFNGDGKSDLIIRNADASAAVLLMNGTSVAAASFLFFAGSPWTVSHVADFDGDSRADIVLNGQIVLRMNGLQVLGAIYSSPESEKIILTGDFNGDGSADIVTRGIDRSVVIRLWTPAGAALSGTYILGPGTTWSVVQVADFNGDGKSDLLLRNADGSAIVYLMDGDVVTASSPVWGPGTFRSVP